MLVPVTSSLYVDGTVTKPDKVLVDIGTGYFVEVNVRGFISRKFASVLQSSSNY
jgi:prefoldin alpha subunit